MTDEPECKILLDCSNSGYAKYLVNTWSILGQTWSMLGQNLVNAWPNMLNTWSGKTRDP